MSDVLAKQIIKKAIKMLFSLEMKDLKEASNYIELLNMCKNLKYITSKKWLFIKALEVVFFTDGKFKEKNEDDNDIKYLDYLINEKSYSNFPNFKNDFNEFIKEKKYIEVFGGLDIIHSEEIKIIAFICEVTKDSKILFDCINAIYSLNIPNYIPPKMSYLFPEDFKTFLEQVEEFINYHDFDENKEYFSLEYDINNGLDIKWYSFEESDDWILKDDNSTSHKDLKRYIANNSIQPSNIKKGGTQNSSQVIDNVQLKREEDEKKDIKINEIEEKKKYEDIGEMNVKSDVSKEYFIELKEIEKNFNEKLRLQEIKYNQEINSLKEKNEEMNRKITSMKKFQEMNVKCLNKKMEKIKEADENLLKIEKEKCKRLGSSLDSSKFSNNELKKDIDTKKKEILKLNTENDKLSRRLNIVACRTISKSVIDFLYYVFTSTFKGSSYSDEKDEIIEKIKERKKNEDEYQDKILTDFIAYLDKIYDIKMEGDIYAHPIVDLNLLIKLIGSGFENINLLLSKLQLNQLFGKYNQYYKLKSKNENADKIEMEIVDMLPEKADNFWQLIRDHK